MVDFELHRGQAGLDCWVFDVEHEEWRGFEAFSLTRRRYFPWGGWSGFRASRGSLEIRRA